MRPRKSPRSSSSDVSAQYPLPVYLDFVPGGVDYGSKSSSFQEHWHNLNYIAPDHLLQKALACDKTLYRYAVQYQIHAVNSSNIDPKDALEKLPIRLPSLSILAEAAFGTLTGVHSSSVRKWADAMVMAYMNDELESWESIVQMNDEDIMTSFESMMKNAPKSSPMKNYPTSPSQSDLIRSLKALHKEYTAQDCSSGLPPVRPCGYVFRRGDIAWNCRTCQYDSTCVLCDKCFHNSDHEGHEVYFHRTSPGGCCDCGDVEAWKAEGCCPLHRPREDLQVYRANLESNDSTMNGTFDDDVFEAFKASIRGRASGENYVRNSLPPKVAAALGVVIGAAVQTVLSAVDGSGIGTDMVQWKRRWSDQIRKINDGRAFDEEYVLSTKRSCAATLSDAMKLPFPARFNLHLRLHNDDVHTYDEVIEALYSGSRFPQGTSADEKEDETDTSHGLVRDIDGATTLTHGVDQDGQVLVKKYETMEGAIAGFRRLKEKGLHCSVVSTPQLELETRARVLLTWLSDICDAHPAVSALVVHALVDTTEGTSLFGGALVWGESRMLPPWSFSEDFLASSKIYIDEDLSPKSVEVGWRRRLEIFPPHFSSSYLSREECRQLHSIGFSTTNELISPKKGVDSDFYTKIPYSLQSERYRKSPHSLWGVMPSPFATPMKYYHPALLRDTPNIDQPHHLLDRLIVLDTDLRKHQEADTLITSLYTHELLGLYMISGIGLEDIDGDEDGGTEMKPTAENWRHLISASSYRAPVSPLLMLLLLDPYPTKQLRGAIHQIFLSLLVDARLRSKFAASLGGIAYRPLTTLFCAGVGTEIDTPLSFTVQIFTAGSIIRALCNLKVTQKLLCDDNEGSQSEDFGVRDVFCLPLAHNIARCIHSNILGACKEVRMMLSKNYLSKKNESGKDLDSTSLMFEPGELPLSALLPAAPDDGFLDRRSIKHKRLSHLLRDLGYVLETPGTAMRLLVPLGDEIPTMVDFASVWSRLLRLAQGLDPLKRKTGGGHIEYEQLRWLEAFSLSLHFSGARDNLAESLPKCAPASTPPTLKNIHDAMGNLFASLIREIKWWLYREGLLTSNLSISSRLLPDGQVEVLQRSTLHVSSTTIRNAAVSMEDKAKTPALSCATQIKMTENHLDIIESAIRIEESQHRLSGSGRGAIMGDWLRVPHSPHAGDSLSFHLPLHRSLSRHIRSLCAVSVPEALRDESPFSWWKIPALDDFSLNAIGDLLDHPLCNILRPTLRSSNCRITWSSGPECSSGEAKKRRSRSKAISAAIASAKVIHSLCDHPLRCLAAADQISRHLWARNGASAGGMALNYGSTPLCRSFRDLDLSMVQLSAAGFSVGLGAKRVFSLILSRFAMEGFLCDLERKISSTSPTNSDHSPLSESWVLPRRLQDMDHCQVLMEGLFSLLCIMVTELPLPPPFSPDDTSPLNSLIRRELLHALSTQNLSYSKALEAASIAVSRKDEHATSTEGDSSFRVIFESVLEEISVKKSQGSKAPIFQLKAEVSDEYDPMFFHLKRSDHQHAMDNIARLRKQKSTENGEKGHCLPIAISPPIAHPRFLPARLVLHLPALDAAIRRALIFVITGGQWLPPSGPDAKIYDDVVLLEIPSTSSDIDASRNVKSYIRRKNSADKGAMDHPFSSQTVKDSSISFLEVLQLLTLQVHTLEQCSLLHHTHPQLDFENKTLSSSISINSYLCRLIYVPSSVADAWFFLPHPDGPLKSQGSGSNKASILGLLITLFEHRSEHGSGGTKEEGRAEEDQGGARYLLADGLKWLLRVVNSLIDGAQSVQEACESATSGTRIRRCIEAKTSNWLIDEQLVMSIKGMLANLSNLWPSENETSAQNADEQYDKNREARKAAQMRILENMRKQQASFAATMVMDEKGNSENGKEEADLCIICRCDDEDGENNGPLGYLGHVQRSRTLQLRSRVECISHKNPLLRAYRVIGDKGCQIRKSISLDSAAVACIPSGCIVQAIEKDEIKNYDLQPRRIFIRYVGVSQTIEGWASIRSSQGYIILSPVVNMCFSNTRWGSTRPFVRQCGHAAHLSCVDTHMASIHQKSQSDTPYDGRFAADIDDGEFLCPLCKQLCNIVIPSESVNDARVNEYQLRAEHGKKSSSVVPSSVRNALTSDQVLQNPDKETLHAIKQYGNYLEQSMQVYSWDPQNKKKRLAQEGWNVFLRNWDFKEDPENKVLLETEQPYVGEILNLMRQQHIAWAVVGYTAASTEASSRGIKRQGFDPSTYDPWSDFNDGTRDTHPGLLELRRTLVAASSLYKLLSREIYRTLNRGPTENKYKPIVATLLSDILYGMFWSVDSNVDQKTSDQWNVLTALLASLPCHVSKDETLSLRHEARATASQMWAIKGFSASFSPKDKNSVTEFPPPPLCIRRAYGKEKLETGWGTLNPSDALNDLRVPFRPGIAHAFLYIPLLTWDLNTFSGAILSTLLACDDVTSTDIIEASRLLLTARMIQVIITLDPNDLESIESSWRSDADMDENYQKKSIAYLYNHCQKMLIRHDFLPEDTENCDLALLQHVSSSMLPLSRSIVLLLRASLSVLRQRNCDQSNDLDEFLESEETMYIEDGFYFLQKIGCLLPSDFEQVLKDPKDEMGSWASLINRWLLSTLTLDTYHGSQGSHLEIDTSTKMMVPKEITHDHSMEIDYSPGDLIVEATEEGMEIGAEYLDRYQNEEIEDDDIEDDDVDDDSEDAIPLNNDNVMIRFGGLNAIDSALDIDDDESDDEEMEDVDGDDDDIFDFGMGIGYREIPREPSLDIQNDESVSGEDQYSWDDEDVSTSDQSFANVATSVIIPYQPSFLGYKAPGPGPRGGALDVKRSGIVMKDLSHIGIAHKQVSNHQGSGLIRLPKSFVELYNLVNKLKVSGQNNHHDDVDDGSSGETAICLVTGAIIRAGTSRRSYSKRSRAPGSCTIHARTVGSGTGVFFLLQKCTVLLIHNKKSAYYSSIYVDSNGEEDPGLARGRPLFLLEERYDALAALWRSHSIPGEVSQIRSTSDRVIRDSWY